MGSRTQGSRGPSRALFLHSGGGHFGQEVSPQWLHDDFGRQFKLSASPLAFSSSQNSFLHSSLKSRTLGGYSHLLGSLSPSYSIFLCSFRNHFELALLLALLKGSPTWVLNKQTPVLCLRYSNFFLFKLIYYLFILWNCGWFTMCSFLLYNKVIQLDLCILFY